MKKRKRHLSNGWSVPFSPWVLESWKAHSEAIGGAEVAARLRENLSNPQAARDRAMHTEEQKQKALAKLTPDERKLLGLDK